MVITANDEEDIVLNAASSSSSCSDSQCSQSSASDSGGNLANLTLTKSKDTIAVRSWET